MHWSDLEHLIAFIKLEIIHCWFGMGGAVKRHKIKGKVIPLYLVEINGQEAQLLLTEHSLS